jgi:hypothetical protein
MIHISLPQEVRKRLCIPTIEMAMTIQDLGAAAVIIELKRLEEEISSRTGRKQEALRHFW